MSGFNWSRVNSRARMRRQGVEDIKGGMSPPIRALQQRPPIVTTKAGLHQEAAAAFMAWRAKAAANPFAGLPRNRFSLIYADPPWRFQVYNEATGSSRAASNHYAVMDLADICALPVGDYLAARDAALFLWCTAPFLEKAFDVIAAWGFKYSSNLVWTKDKLGTGFWCRSQHEHLLIARRGKFRAPKPADRPSSVIQAPRREHSRKPDEVYSIIEQAYPELPKIELFARCARPGWTAWGDEAPTTTQDKQNRLASPVRPGASP
jgi:N6-adenosine-specific RNA methylase IME4